LRGILGITTMLVLAYVGARAKYSQDAKGKQDDKCKCGLNRQRIALAREGLFLTVIVSGIFILAVAEAIQPDGAISILSAIVGCVFGRETGRAGRPGQAMKVDLQVHTQYSRDSSLCFETIVPTCQRRGIECGSRQL